MNFIRTLIHRVVDVLIPKAKEVQELESLIQKYGVQALPRYRNEEVDGINSIFSYQNHHVKNLIHEIKYRRNNMFADSITPLIIDYLIGIYDEKCIGEYEKPILTWIPSSKTTIIERGFQHIDTIRASVQKYDQNFFVHEFPILTFPKNHVRQTQMRSRQERMQNMNNVLTCSNSVSNKILFIGDDVATTGATLHDAKKAAERAGARKVFLFSIAR